MKKTSKYVGLGMSILLFLVVVPYSLVEWFDDRLSFTPILYFFSAVSVILLAYNIYNFRRQD